MPTKSQLVQWGYGDPDAANYAERNIRWLKAGGISVTAHRDLAPLFAILIEGITACGHRLDKPPADDWGYVNRDIAGYPGFKSWHSVGGAIDLDATRQPMGQSKTVFPVNETYRLCARLGLRWGKSFESRPDPMHFEAAYPLARMKRIARALETPDGELAGDQPELLHALGLGSSGNRVKWLQAKLKELGYRADPPTGRFSAPTREQVKAWQRAHGIAVTGVVGVRAWDLLGQQT